MTLKDLYDTRPHRYTLAEVTQATALLAAGDPEWRYLAMPSDSDPTLYVIHVYDEHNNNLGIW